MTLAPERHAAKGRITGPVSRLGGMVGNHGKLHRSGASS